jgi:hypothetical protein
MRTAIWSLTFFCALAANGFAQQGRLAGPVAGFVFDAPAQALRPVLGVPGASVLGEKMNLGFEVKFAAVSPRLDAAIAIATDGMAHFLALADGQASDRTAGLSISARTAVFSPSGSAAALVSTDGIKIVTGLPSAPRLSSTLAPGAGLDSRGSAGAPVSPRRSSLAVSDDGAWVLYASGNSVRLLGAGGADRRLLDLAGSAIVAFAPASAGAAVVDPNGAGLVLFADVASAAARTLAPAAAVGSAAGLAFSPDGSRLLVASPSDRSVLSFDTASGDRGAISCNCAPAGLHRMGNLFRLNDLEKGPLWLLDWNAAEPRTVFVPAVNAN